MKTKLEDLFVSIGQPIAKFTPPMLRLSFGVSVFWFIGFGLLFISIFVSPPPENHDENIRIKAFLVGLVPLGIGTGLARFASQQWRRKVYVCPGGLVVTDGLDYTFFRWGNFSTHVSNIQGSINGIPAGMYCSIEVESPDGLRVKFTRNRIHRVNELIDMILQNNYRRGDDSEAQLQQIVNVWPKLNEQTRWIISNAILNGNTKI